MSERLSERERIIKELKALYDDGFYYIPWDKIADFILADRARIVEPLVRYKKRMSYFKIWRTKENSEIYDMIDITINLAQGGKNA